MIAYFGALKAGAIITATSPIYTPREAGHQWKDAGASVVIVDHRLLRIVKAVRPELPELKHVVEIGLRDYYPANFTALKRSLKTKGKASARSLARLVQQTAPIAWRDFLSVAKTPRPVVIKQSDIACLQYTGGHHRLLQGRNVDARQSGHQRPSDAAMAGRQLERAGCDGGGPAAVPHLRDDVHHDLFRDDRRRRRAAAAL